MEDHLGLHALQRWHPGRALRNTQWAGRKGRLLLHTAFAFFSNLFITIIIFDV